MHHKYIAFAACLMVVVGLYSSRALISIGMMVLFANSLLNPNIKEELKYFWKQKHLVMLTGYFILAALSYFWTDDTVYLAGRLRIMLPFLVLPFAFTSIGKWEAKWYHFIMLVFIFLNYAGISWSLYHYLENKEHYDIGYSFSQQIPTPFKGDHIRFSFGVVMSILFSIYLIKFYKLRFLSFILAIGIIYSAIYLHILAVKTGIIAFYFVSLLWIIKLLLRKRYRKYAILGLVLTIALPILMYEFSDTFHSKLGYIRYSIEQMKNNKKEANISDEGRLISYQYALKLIEQHPILGVGYGDVFNEMKKKYDLDFPNENVKVLLPHNQFLMVGAGLGLLGLIYFIFMQLLLLQQIRKQDFLYTSFILISLFALMIEPFYENQYGACLLLFFLLLLLQRKRTHHDHTFSHPTGNHHHHRHHHRHRKHS